MRLVRVRTISAHPCDIFGRLSLLGPKGPEKSLDFAIPSEQKRPFLKKVGCKWPPSEPFSQISSILCPNISHHLLDQPHPLYSGVLSTRIMPQFYQDHTRDAPSRRVFPGFYVIPGIGVTCTYPAGPRMMHPTTFADKRVGDKPHFSRIFDLP
jgi:hypothetical protein